MLVLTTHRILHFESASVRVTGPSWAKEIKCYSFTSSYFLPGLIFMPFLNLQFLLLTVIDWMIILYPFVFFPLVALLSCHWLLCQQRIPDHLEQTLQGVKQRVKCALILKEKTSQSSQTNNKQDLLIRSPGVIQTFSSLWFLSFSISCSFSRALETDNHRL